MEYPKRSSSVHVEQVGGELCVYHLEGHQVHALNRSAALVWERCDGRTSRAQIAAALRSEFDVADVDAVVGLALEELNRAHLLAEPLQAVTPGLSRRRLLRGGLAAAAIPVVYSIVAPQSAAAQSPNCIGLPTFDGVLGLGSPNWPFVSGALTARSFRDGEPTVCGTQKACQPPISGAFIYDAYTFTNTCGLLRCVNVSLTLLNAQADQYFLTMFLGSFVPSNVCTNFLADSGSSAMFGGHLPTTVSASANVPNGSTYVVVVNNVSANPGGSYRIQIGTGGLPAVGNGLKSSASYDRR